MTYQEALDYLYNSLPVFHNVGSAAYKPGFENTIKLMEALGNPHEKFRSIHVAGTNGKGSVSHFLSAILQAAGYKVGLYTSPHLVDFGERIRVDGKMIETSYVVDFVESNHKLLGQIRPSFFETSMSMALKYFADCRIDIAIVEVGLGGRLDSTNIIHPILSVITNIAFDHVEFLGDTLPEIASEKAGIIKKNAPVVIGEYLPETKPVFEQKAFAENAPIVFAEDEIQLRFLAYKDGKMLVETSKNEQLLIGLSGVYQLKNIATVLTACNDLLKCGVFISAQDMRDGLENVVEMAGLQGRWQRLSEKPLVIADTGHNAAGIRYVAEQLREQHCETLRLVIGMVNDKDITAVLQLLPKNAVYYFTQANVARAMPSEKLREKAVEQNLAGTAFPTVSSAIEKAMQDASENDLIFIGGSNFVVGEAIIAVTSLCNKGKNLLA
ncbi:MAG: bifunctional folylpolyglutamate synthase/dihydrofolate synthase [Prevotellaceae bacterium]|jgi:dihydrofolate synthase/folylpolyglutamate synthase|nr:bifunctional folylpolyglutamate synthase/dihydrofolate synthase [Prevotellaceae bacterium]